MEWACWPAPGGLVSQLSLSVSAVWPASPATVFGDELSPASLALFPGARRDQRLENHRCHLAWAARRCGREPEEDWKPLMRGPAVSTANPNVANRRQQPARAYAVWIPLPAPETPSTSPVPNTAVVSPPDDRPTTTLEVAIKIPAPTTATLPARATAPTHHRPAAATTAAPDPRAATAGAAATTATGARPGTTAAATTTSSATHAEALREGRREHHEGRRDGSDNRDFREHVFLSRKKNNGLVART